MRARRRSATLLTIGIVLSACTTSESATGSTDNLDMPPDLPPVESLVIDLSFFTGAEASGVGASSEASTTRDHWETATARVTTTSADVTEALALPVATLAAASQETAAFDGNRWHWRFVVTHGGLTYDGDLSGITAGEQTSFDARLSQPSLGLSGFTWYSGAAPVTGDSGFWRFFNPRSGASAGRVDWQRPSADAGTVVFSVIGDAANNGDVLTYEVSGTDRRMRYVEFATGNVVEVSWDESTGAGYMTADGYNGGAKSCWDGDQNDMVCPP